MNSATLVDITKNLKTSIGEKAIDREVLKTIAQSLTPEQKAQVLKNLEGTFLPLTGGELTGAIYRPDTTGTMILRGGTNSWDSGASLYLHGRDSDNGARFQLLAKNLTQGCDLSGHADGKLTWDGKGIEIVDSKGDKWIRFTSGLQICWDLTEYPGVNSVVINYPVPFSTAPASFIDGGNGATSTAWNPTSIHVATSANELSFFIWLAIGWWK